MAVGAPNADDAMNSKESALKFPNVFVTNALDQSIALVARMKGRQVRLKEQDKLPGSFPGLRELHRVKVGLTPIALPPASASNRTWTR